MGKIKLVGCLLIVCLVVGCNSEMPTPTEGTYPLKTKTLTIFDLFSEEYNIYNNIAEVVESKPEKLSLDFELSKLSEYRFGSFVLGNNGQRTWFVMGKDEQGYWSEVYIDQNNDYIIKENEKIKSFNSGQDKVKGLDRYQSMSMIPVKVRVSYKCSSGEIQKNLYFFIITTVYSKKGASDLLVEAITASFLDGQIDVASGETINKMNFRLIDANGNGCFNDYGTDLILIDLNFNNYYQRKECFKLVEFFNFPISTEEQKQLRIIVPPYPAKIAVIGADQDYDLNSLEAKSDQEENMEDESDDPREETSKDQLDSPGVAPET